MALVLGALQDAQTPTAELAVREPSTTHHPSGRARERPRVVCGVHEQEPTGREW